MLFKTITNLFSYLAFRPQYYNGYSEGIFIGVKYRIAELEIFHHWLRKMIISSCYFIVDPPQYVLRGT
jgi:hypothetical protein